MKKQVVDNAADSQGGPLCVCQIATRPAGSRAMFMLIGLATAVFALALAKGRRVSIAAACWTAGLALSIPRPDHTTPSDWLVASLIVTVVFSAIAYALVRIAARLTGAISRLGARTAP